MHAELRPALAHDQRAPVLRAARPVDRVHDLEWLCDLQAGGDVQERAARPQRRVGGLQLVAVVRQALGVPLREQLRVLARGLLQRAQDHAAPRQLGVELDVHHGPVALHDPPGALALGERVAHHLRHAGIGAVVAHLQPVEVEPLEARRPEARAPPHRQLRGLVHRQRRFAQLLERAAVARAGAVQRVVERRLAVAPRLDRDLRH